MLQFFRDQQYSKKQMQKPNKQFLKYIISELRQPQITNLSGKTENKYNNLNIQISVASVISFSPQINKCKNVYVDIFVPRNQIIELSWWLRGKEPTCHRRIHGFDPQSGKISWRRKAKPTPVLLPRESHGLQSMGSQRVRTK